MSTFPRRFASMSNYMPKRRTLFWLSFLYAGVVAAQAPSFNCDAARGIIETLICQDPGLAALDRQMAEVYAAAEAKSHNEFPFVLKPEQRAWTKDRNGCWTSDERRACVSAAYRLRIAELQVRYRLIEPFATADYVCPDKAVVSAAYFNTDPATLLATRGDSTSLMYVQPSASGARYVGRHASLWEHQGAALIQWGYGAAEMTCRKQP